MQRTHTNRPFTLIELMVVIAIIAIIMGLSVPVFRNISVGSAVDASSRMLSSQLMLARAEAIARRRYVAVIIPGEFFNKRSDDASIYNFTSFRSAFVKLDSSNNFLFDEWVPGTQWTFLPTGALIQILETSVSCPVAIEKSGDKYVPKSSYTIPNDSSSGGKGVGCEAECTSVKDDSGNYMVDSDNANSTHGVRAIVFKPNGRCAQKNFLTIMEGVVETASNTTTRLNMQNVRVMKVDPYTGQVCFYRF